MMIIGIKSTRHTGICLAICFKRRIKIASIVVQFTQRVIDCRGNRILVIGLVDNRFNYLQCLIASIQAV